MSRANVSWLVKHIFAQEAGITSPLGTDPTPFSEGGMQQNYALLKKCKRKKYGFYIVSQF